MYHAAQEHVIYTIANAPLRTYPFPHLYVDSIFPPDYYAELRRNWPNASQFVTLESTGRVPKGAYPERFFMPLSNEAVGKLPEESQAFWTEFATWMLVSDRLLGAVLDKFEPFVRARFDQPLEDVEFSHEVLVVRDHSNYKLGPHTDAPHRVLSLLFYCPDDLAYSHLGTSLYTPIDPAFRCAGGPHYPHDWFRRVATMEYKPNTLFAFLKTDQSFHGVEPIRDADVLRDLILYDIRTNATATQPEQQPGKQPKEAPGERPDGAGDALGLKILKNILRRTR